MKNNENLTKDLKIIWLGIRDRVQTLTEVDLSENELVSETAKLKELLDEEDPTNE
jgi:hypothetical protein